MRPQLRMQHFGTGVIRDLQEAFPDARIGYHFTYEEGKLVDDESSEVRVVMVRNGMNCSVSITKKAWNAVYNPASADAFVEEMRRAIPRVDPFSALEHLQQESRSI